MNKISKEQFFEMQDAGRELLEDEAHLNFNLFIHKVKEKNRFFNEKYPEASNAFSLLIKMSVMDTPDLPQLWYDSMRYL